MDLLWKERKRIWCGLPLTFTVYSYDNERFYVKSGFLNQRQDEVRSVPHSGSDRDQITVSADFRNGNHSCKFFRQNPWRF